MSFYDFRLNILIWENSPRIFVFHCVSLEFYFRLSLWYENFPYLYFWWLNSRNLLKLHDILIILTEWCRVLKTSLELVKFMGKVLFHWFLTFFISADCRARPEFSTLWRVRRVSRRGPRRATARRLIPSSWSSRNSCQSYWSKKYITNWRKSTKIIYGSLLLPFILFTYSLFHIKGIFGVTIVFYF